MRACAQIRKIVSLAIEGNLRILGKILDQLHLVGLVPLLHEGDGFLSWQGKTLQLCALLDDLLHLRFQLIQVFPGEGFTLKIIVKSVLDGGTDSQLRLRIQPLYRLSQHMGCGVTQGSQPLLVARSQNIQLAVLGNNGAQILNLSVYLSGTGRSRQPLADVGSNLIDASRIVILFLRSVFQCDDHVFFLLPENVMAHLLLSFP